VALEFRILGPLEVVDGNRELRLAGAKQRVLLAVLLVHANEPVSVDVLTEELWGGEPPPTAVKMVQGYISQLRKVLGDGVLVTRAPGYLVRVEADGLDASRFERLVADAAGRPPDEAAKLLGAALRLWRGAPLVDFAYERFAQSEIARLEEARLGALEERIDADLDRGRHAAVVSELEALVAEHPFRERLIAELMLALYRCGRQTEALEVYRRAQQALDRELGLEPSPSLRELEQQILVHDPALRASPRTRVVPPRLAHHGRGIAIAGAALVVVAAVIAGWEVTRGSAAAVTIIDPGISPGSIAVERDVGWATNAATNSVSRIDLRMNTRAGTVPVGDSPSGIAAGGGFVWVANSLGGSVTKIDPRGDGGSGGVADTIAVGNGPSGLTFGGGRVWVANSLDHTVSEIDPSSPSAPRRIPVPAGADAIAYGFGSLWVVSGPANTVTRIDARTRAVLARTSVGNDPTAIAMGEGAVWVANSLDGTVSKIDPHTGTVDHLVYVGGSPTSIAAGRGAVWVGDPRLSTLSRIDPIRDKVVETLHTTNPPQGLAVSAGRLYATVGPPSAAHRGGTLTVLTYPWDSIDPAVAYEVQGSWSVLGMTNDGLLTYQRVGGTDGIRIVSDLATSLPTISNDGRTYTFQVRRGIHYSNGTLVRPADFRRAIERALQYQSLNPPLGPGFYFEQIVGAGECVKTPKRCDLRRGIVTDPRLWTVTFHLTQPDSDFLNELALPAADAVPAGTPFKARLPLPATGPYMIASYDAARRATLVRNPSFHEWSAAAQPRGYPAKIVYILNKPEKASVSAVQHDLGDYTTIEDLEATAALRRTGYGSQVHTNPELAAYYFFFNTTMAPFNRVDVRRAVNEAIDRARLARLYGAGTGLTAQSTCQILPPNTVGYVRSCLYPYDLAKAKRLVAKSGTAGRTVTVSTGPPGLKASAYLVSVLDSLGYKARLKAYKNLDAFHAVRDRGETEIAPKGDGADFPAPSGFFTLLLTCETSRNPEENLAAFCDPGIDREIDRARTLATGSQAAALAWSKIDHEVMQKAPLIPIAIGTEVDLISRRVGNYQFNPFWGVLPDQLWVR
jgi:peptide/nickel transport system substrate-binding protein